MPLCIVTVNQLQHSWGCYNIYIRTVQVIKKCPDVLSVLLGTDNTTVRSTVSTTVHSTVSTYIRYAKKSVRTVR